MERRSPLSMYKMGVFIPLPLFPQPRSMIREAWRSKDYKSNSRGNDTPDGPMGHDASLHINPTFALEIFLFFANLP